MSSPAAHHSYGTACAVALAGLTILSAFSPASAAGRQYAREACVIEAQSQFGDSWRRIERRIERGTNIVEFWISDADAGPGARVYCRYNDRTRGIETIAMLAEGEFRPRR